MKSNHLPAGTVLMDTNVGWHGRCNRLTGDAAGDITSRFPRPALRDRSQFVQSAVSYPLSCARRRENPPRPLITYIARDRLLKCDGFVMHQRRAIAATG